MSTLLVTEDTDFRALSVTALDGIGVIDFENSGSDQAIFNSDQFANGRPLIIFAGISDTVKIIGASRNLGFTSAILAELSGFVTFSAAGWTFENDVPDITLVGANTNDTITGSTVDDTIRGGLGVDTLNGNSGNDSLNGGNGADTLNGGSGSDTASYANAPAGGGGLGVTVVMLNTGLNGGEAVGDTYNSIENLRGSQFQDLLAGNNAVNKISGSAGNDTLFGQGGGDTLNGDDGDDTLNGQADDDLLHGGNGADTLFGGDGDDRLFGDANDDTLIGGLNADGLFGGAGIDTASYANAASIGLLGVTAFMRNTSLNTGEATGDIYNSVENLTGSNFNDLLGGSTGANFIFGGNGDDTLDGGLGADTLSGGNGSDTASYANASAGLLVSLATPNLNGGEAAGDTYISIESLTGSAFGDILGGNSGFNILKGGNGDDLLFGEGGNDRLEGGEGGDTLDGGSGADTLIGGAGNDRFRFDTGSDVVAGESIDGGASGGGFDGLVLENAGTVNFGLATLTGVEILQFLNGTSTAIFNANQIGASAAAIVAGNVASLDTIIVNGGAINLAGMFFSNWASDDLISLNGTAGADAITASSQNDTVSGGDGDDTLTGGDGNDLLRGELDNDTISGNAGNDRLRGGAGADILTGGDGRDVLTGGGGADQFDYNAISESGVTAVARDAINGFSHGIDKIDLSTIDANTDGGGADDSFSFITAGPFTAAGQVRAIQSGLNTIVRINTDADAATEATILLLDFTASTLTAADFVL